MSGKNRKLYKRFAHSFTMVLQNKRNPLMNLLLDLYCEKIETVNGPLVPASFTGRDISPRLELLVKEKAIKRFNGYHYMSNVGLDLISKYTASEFENDFTASRKRLRAGIQRIDEKYNHNRFLTDLVFMFQDEDCVDDQLTILDKIGHNHASLKEDPIIYLGAHGDVGSTLLLPGKEYYFVDQEYSKSEVMEKIRKGLQTKVGKIKAEIISDEETVMEFNDIKIHFMAGDFTDIQATKAKLPAKFSGLIVKKTSRTASALKYLDRLSVGGYFLESDIVVQEEIPGLNRLYTGRLTALTVFDDNEIDSYSANLWRKEQ